MPVNSGTNLTAVLEKKAWVGDEMLPKVLKDFIEGSRNKLEARRKTHAKTGIGEYGELLTMVKK